MSNTYTAAICAETFSSSESDTQSKEKRIYCCLLNRKCPRDDVESVFFLGYSMAGEAYILERGEFPAQPEDLVFARKWILIAEKLWAEGKWKPHPEKVGERGLLGCIEGMEELRQGRVSGVKLVYRVDETAWPL